MWHFFVQYVLALLAYQGKDIVFIFIIEYSSLRDFGAYLYKDCLKDDILACVETWD